MTLGLNLRASGAHDPKFTLPDICGRFLPSQERNGRITMNSDILFFFGEHMDALPLYERLEDQILTQIPEVKIKVAKTQITFANKRGFAFVSFNPCRKAKNRPEIWMTITFGLGYRIDSPRIDVATEPYPNRWTHHVMVGNVDEIDVELMRWIAEAADFSANKR